VSPLRGEKAQNRPVRNFSIGVPAGNKVCYKVSLSENFQQQSYSMAIPVSNDS